ncbi:MAG: peptidoglycan editing factor PgeF [Methylococcales bacterium]|nr:peptidoglycan editing factor PgeF [Methylococcales bacterium]MDD5753526.1 peptidoglycan editing factor PgeF [Methylococcales bacterium]
MLKNDNFIFLNWNAPPNVHAAMTTRIKAHPSSPPSKGGKNNCYADFNLATHVGDDLENVLKNRRLLKTELSLPNEPFWLEQIHSNTVVEVSTDLILPRADASYSHQKDVVCAVMTADCLPVLMCSTDGTQIAAIHAGWRGLANGIISNTVAALKTTDLIVWLGAAIGAECFEVGDDVRDTFLKKSADYSIAFKAHPPRPPSKGGDWQADIYELARIELLQLGITQIYGGEFCTVTDAEHFYSYRRDKQTGRMATLIWRT